MIRALDCVVLVHDLPAEGLSRGDLGTVVEVHGPDAFEVEFVRASGGTQAVVALVSSDVREVRDDDMIAVRALRRAV